MNFGWIKLFNDPPQSPQMQSVLLRIDVTAATTLTDLQADLAAKLPFAQYVAAWEIGNEPNIDAEYGWGAPPNALAYKPLLCAAYAQIKAADPDAIVVSAGLAPTGRVSGNFNGHPGHDGLKQDDRQFLIKLLDSGGGACLDVVGYHPYGYSADYDAVPDVTSADPTQNCLQGFCFRGAEKIYEIMQQKGLGDQEVVGHRIRLDHTTARSLPERSDVGRARLADCVRIPNRPPIWRGRINTPTRTGRGWARCSFSTWTSTRTPLCRNASRCVTTASSIGRPTQRLLMCPKIPLPFPAN